MIILQLAKQALDIFGVSNMLTAFVGTVMALLAIGVALAVLLKR